MAINTFPIGTRKVDVDAILKADTDSKNALEQIKDLTVGVTTLSPGAAATSAYDPDTFVLSLGIPEGEQGIQGPPGTTDYTELTNVPATFPPSAHTHVISEVTNLQTSLNAKQATSEKGVANGYAGLDGDGKVPEAQLPSIDAVPATAYGVGALLTAGSRALAYNTEYMPGHTVAGSSLVYSDAAWNPSSLSGREPDSMRIASNGVLFGATGTWRLQSRVSNGSDENFLAVALWQRIA